MKKRFTRSAVLSFDTKAPPASSPPTATGILSYYTSSNNNNSVQTKNRCNPFSSIPPSAPSPAPSFAPPSAPSSAPSSVSSSAPNIYTVKVYTDGSCLGNGKKGAIGGIGAYFGSRDPRNISERVRSFEITDETGTGKSTHCSKITNQTMELLACVRAIQSALRMQSQQEGLQAQQAAARQTNICIYVYTDSEYVMKSMNVWAKTWSKNNWKTRDGRPVSNEKLMRLLYALKVRYCVSFHHVPAHRDPPTDKNSPQYAHWLGNKRADELATDATSQSSCTYTKTVL